MEDVVKSLSAIQQEYFYTDATPTSGIAI